MSYDLSAFRLQPGQTIEEYYEELERHEDDSPPTPEEREQMEALATAVAAVDPAVERHDDADYIEFSHEHFQVSIYAREAGIEIPYWFDGEQADAVLEHVMVYAQVLADAGYTVYDPQTDSVVDASDARRKYDAGRELVKEIASEQEPPRRRRWWRRR